MKKNLFKSTIVFSGMTVVSRITGLVRELIFASIFGASVGLDAFLVAYQIPNFLRRLFAEGAFSQAFVPVLSEYHSKQGFDATKVFLNHMAGLMLVILSIFTVIAILITPWLVYVFAPGFSALPGKLALTASMLKITFPYILFISLSAYVSGILNTYGKFGVPAFTPNLLNLALIGAALLAAPYFTEPVKALAWGIFFGGLLQLFFQLPFLWRLGLMPRPTVLWKDAGVRKVLGLMIPAIFGVSVTQISVLLNTWLASFLQSGSISWLYFSDRLTSFPLGVFGVAIATVVLPYLSRKYVTNSHQEYSHALDWGLRFVFVIALPAAIGISMLAGPILVTLFHHGKFTAFDVVMARSSLLGFALGIPGFMLVKVLASGFYSRQNIKTPVKIAAISMVANIVLALTLIFPLKHAGLAFAISISSMLNAFLLFFVMRKNGFYVPGKGWGIFWLRLAFANVVLFIVLWFAGSELALWLDWSWFTRVWHLAALCCGAGVVYLFCLWFGGMKLHHFILHE